MSLGTVTAATHPAPLSLQVIAVYADDVLLALGGRQGGAPSLVLFSVGIQESTVGDPVDVD